jgi:hypothetical protein
VKKCPAEPGRAPLFKELGGKKERGDRGRGKVYVLTEEERDQWANLFEYTGSEEKFC